MNDDQFNMNIRKYLKKVGITSQREIESAVRKAEADGKIKGDEALSVTVTLSVTQLDLTVHIDGEIAIS